MAERCTLIYFLWAIINAGSGRYTLLCFDTSIFALLSTFHGQICSVDIQNAGINIVVYGARTNFHIKIPAFVVQFGHCRRGRVILFDDQSFQSLSELVIVSNLDLCTFSCKISLITLLCNFRRISNFRSQVGICVFILTAF